MLSIVWGAKWAVARWVIERIPGMTLETDDFEALGVVRNGELVAGVVYNHFTGHDICMHVAAEPGKIWAKPKILYALFSYPFNQLKCRRVTGFVASQNAHTLPFDKKLGFVEEGRLRDATPEGDMIVIGMRRSECRWLGEMNGKERQYNAAD